jgi:SAM-dependent methyltransferase
MKRYEFWKKEWVEKAKEENPFVAAGASNFAKTPFEFLHNFNYICKNLDLQTKDVLLDIGCNTGLYCVTLAYWVKKIKGIDYIPELVERAFENSKDYSNIEVKKGDILNIPFEANSFDKVLVNSVVHYLEDVEAIKDAFQEIGRVTKKGGKVLISLIPDATKKQKYLDGIAKLDLPEQRKIEIYKKNETALWLYPKELVKIAKEVGFNAKILPISKGVWQSWYMFNMIFKKEA